MADGDAPGARLLASSLRLSRPANLPEVTARRKALKSMLEQKQGFMQLDGWTEAALPECIDVRSAS
jgi:hypothetical protein